MFGRDQGKVLPRAGGGQDIESGLPESDKSDRVGEVWEGGGEGVGREGGEPSGVVSFVPRRLGVTMEMLTTE